MGEAKRRGSFEDRKKQAIAADRQIKMQRNATPAPIALCKGKSTTSMMLAIALAASATRVLK